MELFHIVLNEGQTRNSNIHLHDEIVETLFSTGPPTYQIIKVPNANHMSVMKTSLTIILMCPRELLSHYKKLSRLILCYKKDWAILLHFIYTCYLLPIKNYLITKLSVTDNFSVCREYLTENCLSFPSAPRWVRYSYLSKGLR